MADEIMYLKMYGLIYDADTEANLVNKAISFDDDYEIVEELKEGDLISLSEGKAVVVPYLGDLRIKVTRELTPRDEEVLNRTGLRWG